MYRYTINFYEPHDDEDIIESGMVGAASYGEAVTKLEHYYGGGIEGYVIYDITIYRTEDILTDDELQDL
jgi:hypothetical protein